MEGKRLVESERKRGREVDAADGHASEHDGPGAWRRTRPHASEVRVGGPTSMDESPGRDDITTASWPGWLTSQTVITEASNSASTLKCWRTHWAQLWHRGLNETVSATF